MTTSRAPRAASAPQRAGAPEIAECVHAAICEVTGSDGSAHGIVYARVAAGMATLATAHRFKIRAGTAHLDGLPLLAAHAWVTRLDPGEPGSGQSAPEVVDLTLRHWPAWAAAAGRPLGRNLPPYLWGTSADLDRLGIALAEVPEQTAEVGRGYPDELARVAAALAIELLAKRYPRTASTLRPPKPR